MSEARQLGPKVGLPESREPRVDALEAGTDAVPTLSPADDADVDLSLEAAPKSAHAASLTPRRAGPAALDRASRAALIFLVIGFFAFVAGIALASAILLGVLDIQTGWVKDTLSAVKALVKHFSSK